jgi:hypothetical protein
MSHAYVDTPPRSTEWPMPATLRRVMMVVPPLAFAGFEVLHPQPEVNPQAVMEVATWFAAFHAIQLVLIGLVAVSVLLLAEDFGAARAWTTRLGLGVFLIVFSAYDAIAGIATGLAMRSARDLPAAQQEGVWQTVKDWPGFNIPVFTLNVVGTLGWVLALIGVALAARRGRAPRAEWIFIALAGVFLMAGHPFPGGTLAFGCLFVAALLHQLRGRSEPETSEAR